MTSSVEIGRLLEQHVAAFFRAHGYEARCNEVVEGRSGGRHEVDVLAETSDTLTTYRVAVECKAWRQPIEKDVVSKLHYILGDLGLHKGIIVSLAGCTSGAERAAADLGVELWGPDELRHHLGEAVFNELGTPPVSDASGGGAGRTGLGYAIVASPVAAERTVRASGKGRLGLRTLEQLRWFSPLWVPAYWVRLTVAQPEERRFTTRLRSVTVDNVYEALGGTFLGPMPGPWEEVDVDRQAALRPVLRDSKLQGSLRKALHDYERVSATAAVERHQATLERLGIPTPCASLSIDQTTLVHLPYFAGILEADGSQRVVAVNGRSGEVSEPVSELLTANVALLRSQLSLSVGPG